MRRLPLVTALTLALLAGCASQSEMASTDDSQEPLVGDAKAEYDQVTAKDAATANDVGADAAALPQMTAKGVRRVEKPEADAAAPVLAAPAPPAALEFVMVTGSHMANESKQNTERYQNLPSNPVIPTLENAVSTFSIDVDTGSYSNVRRMLNQGQRPPKDAVRAEEMINYFDYRYPSPVEGKPFSVTTELANAPWNSDRQLLLIGLQGQRVDFRDAPASNLVFLIDTSGSMQDHDKLPLLKRSFATLVEHLRPQDQVSIVVYAGSAGLVLPPTSGKDKHVILEALERLEAGGSTNGGAGIALAYDIAKRHQLKGGINRVVLATDGDFNVGTTDQSALETLVTDQRKHGVSLTTLGFGQGNYNEQMAERLADLGDGNHAYIDSLQEARKVLSSELGATLRTIAKDVKIQVEFNPAVVAEYRLIGYENRQLRREDFNNDKVDAGEIGAGHDVTALYELTLVGAKKPGIEPLRYQKAQRDLTGSGELATLRLRYKQPNGERSQLIEEAILNTPRSTQRLQWAAAVAAYADLLRGGEHSGDYGWQDVAALARRAQGRDDANGSQNEFLRLLGQARQLIQGDTTTSGISMEE